MKLFILLATSLLFAGCDAGEPEVRDDTVGKEIADDYNQALDKARNVEVQLQDRVDSMEQSMKNPANEAQDP